MLRSSEDIEILEPQSLSIVCFRYAPPKLRENAQALDALNKAILEKLQLSGQGFLSSVGPYDSRAKRGRNSGP